MDPSVIVIVVGIVGLVYCGGYLLTVLADRYSVQLDARLSELQSGPARPFGRNRGTPGGGTIVQWAGWTALFNRLLPDTDRERRRHQARLLQAGIYNPIALSTFFAAKLTLMVLPPAIGVLAGWLGMIDINVGIVSGCAFGGLGMILPAVWLERRIARRHILLARSLEDFLDLLIVCLDSGLSLQGAIQRVGDELRIAHPVLAGELSIVQRDIELGATIDMALRRCADRTGFDGIRTFSTFVRETQRYGTALSEALQVHADMLRTHREQAAEEMVQKASVKILLPMLLLILPAVFVVVAGPAVIQIQEAFSK